MASVNITVAQYLAHDFNASDTVTVLDTSENLAGLSAGDIAQLHTLGVEFVDASDDALVWNVAQWQAVPAGIGFDISDFKVVEDTGAHLAGLSTSDLSALGSYGVTLLSPQDGVASFTVAQYQALGGISFDADATVTLADTGAHLGAMSQAEFGALEIKGFDVIDASDDAWTITAASALSLGNVTIDASDAVTLTGPGADIASLTAGQFTAFGFSAIDASDDSLTLNDAQLQAVLGAGGGLSGLDNVTLADTGAVLGGEDFAALAAANVDQIDATDDVLTIDVADANILALGGEIGLTASDTVTLADTGANIAAFSSTDLFLLGLNGVDVLDATDNVLNLTVSQMAGALAGQLSFTDADVTTLADVASTLDGLAAADIDVLNLHKVDEINATDGAAYSFDALAARAFLNGAVFVAADDNVALADTGANIAGLLATQIAGLHAYGFDVIDATDDVLSLSVGQYLHLNGLTLTGDDAVTLLDTGANIASLSATEMGELGVAGIDILDASDDVLHLTVDQWKAIFYDSEIGLAGSDAVTIVDTGAHLAGLTPTDIGNLAGSGVHALDASDDVVSFSIAQASALATGEFGLAAGDAVTVSDTEANIEALSAGAIASFGDLGADFLHASDTGVLNITAAQAMAAADSPIGFAGADTVTLYDTGANIAGVAAGAYADFAFDGVDAIDASDDLLNLSVASYRAISATTLHLTSGDTVTLADAGANLADLSVAEIGQLAANRVDRINATNNVLKLSVAQFNALGAVTLAGGDVVSLLDTGANLATLNFSTLAGKNVDLIDATDNVLTLSYAQFSALGTVSLAAGDDVTLTATSTAIEGLSGSQLLALGGKGVDHIDTTDNELHFSLSQFNNLGSVTVASNDVFTILDTGANLAGVGAGKINQFNAAGVDFIDSSSGAWNMSAAAAGALAAGSAKATAADTVTVVDTGAALAALSAGAIGLLGSHNVDGINASDDTLSLSVGQYGALGTVALTGSDLVTLADSGALIAGQGPSFFQGLAAAGVDVIDATDDVLNLTVAKFQALNTPAVGSPVHTPAPPSGVGLTSGDTVTLLDTGVNLAALTAGQIGLLAAQNVDFLDSTTNLLTLDAAQFNALGEVGLTGADVVTIKDTGANLVTLGVSMLGAQGVDRIDASDNALTASQSFIDALGSAGVALTKADLVTMTASAAVIEGLTPGQFAAYAAQGVDVLDCTDFYIPLGADQVAAVVNTGLTFGPDDSVEILASSADLFANLGALFGSLAGAGIDGINLSDDAIDLTVAQAMALGSVSFSWNDTVVLLDTGANIEALTVAQMNQIGSVGVSRFDAIDDVLSFTAAQLDGLVFAGEMGLTQEDDITLTDTGANIAGFDRWQLGNLASVGVDHVALTDHQISLNYAQFRALTADFSFTGLDTITAKGTEAANTLGGGDEHDVFDGRGGADSIDGGRGADTIIGGLGADVLTGGIGADTFVFRSLADSAVGAADRITDLTNVDVIDLSAIDANSGAAGDQAFHEVHKFTGHAGEMVVKFNAGSGLTLIKLDVDGDGHADAQIAVDGDHHSFENFVL